MQLSIVVPVYNSETYITKMLVSLKYQTYQNFKIIFVDDGSTDKTVDFIIHFMKDVRIPYEIIYSQHHGVSHARNLGLQEVDTDFLLYLDSDDHIEFNMLENLMREMVDRELDIIWCGYDHMKNNKVVWSYFEDYIKVENVISGIELLNLIFENEAHVITSNAIYKTKFAKQFMFRKNINYHEDIEFFYKVISRAKRIAFIDKIYVHYVMRDKSLSHDLNYSKLLDGVKSLNLLYDYLEEQGFPIKVIQKIYTLVIPRTIYVFFNYCCLEIESIDFFKNNGYFDQLKRYSLINFKSKTIKLYLKVKFASSFPRLFRIIKKFLI